MAHAQRRRNDDGQALVVQPPRLPMPSEVAPLGFDEGQWKALVDAVFPSAKTVDGVLLAITYCKERGLDIFKRPVHVVPMWNSALNREVETVWPGIADYRTTASRTGQWAGNDECLFGPTLREGFKEKANRGKGENAYVAQAKCAPFDFPEWAQVTVYKFMAGQRVAFVGPKVYFKEIFSGDKGLRVPNARWRQAPWQMLEKCAEAAALRRAFPEELGNDYTAEEMSGKAYAGDPIQALKEEHGTGAGAQIEQKPTRESVRPIWERLGIPKDCWDEIERLQIGMNEPGAAVDGLKLGKEKFLDLYAPEWPEAALDELEKRFDDAIARLQGELPSENEGGNEAHDETSD